MVLVCSACTHLIVAIFIEAFIVISYLLFRSYRMKRDYWSMFIYVSLITSCISTVLSHGAGNFIFIFLFRIFCKMTIVGNILYSSRTVDCRGIPVPVFGDDLVQCDW